MKLNKAPLTRSKGIADQTIWGQGMVGTLTSSQQTQADYQYVDYVPMTTTTHVVPATSNAMTFSMAQLTGGQAR